MSSCTSGHGTLHLIPTLLNLSPSILHTADISGNTAMHHASAAGELKALRMLLQYGANPLVQNAYSWTPVHYSATPAAEAYFKTLIIEFEKSKAEGKRIVVERERQRNAGVRLVTTEDVVGVSQQMQGGGVMTPQGRPSVEGRPSGSGGAPGRPSMEGRPSLEGRHRARDDAAIAGLPAPGMTWSPIEKRRAMTPTEGRQGQGWEFLDGARPRAGSGV
jgi:hypothetical protein